MFLPLFPRARGASPPDHIPRETDRAEGVDLPSTAGAKAVASPARRSSVRASLCPDRDARSGFRESKGSHVRAPCGARADNRPTNCETCRSAQSPAAGLQSSRDISFSLRSNKGYRVQKAAEQGASGENEFAS